MPWREGVTRYEACGSLAQEISGYARLFSFATGTKKTTLLGENLIFYGPLR